MMTKGNLMNLDKLRFALGILSGRIEVGDNFDWDRLGYDPYRFGAFGTPSASDVREKAEDIVYDAIVEVTGIEKRLLALLGQAPAKSAEEVYDFQETYRAWAEWQGAKKS
jgi:hypothetical protein